MLFKGDIDLSDWWRQVEGIYNQNRPEKYWIDWTFIFRDFDTEK